MEKRLCASNSVRVFLTKNSVLTKKNHYLLKSDIFYVSINPSVETHLAVVRGFPPRSFYPSASTRRAQLSIAAKVVRPTDLLNNVRC